VTLYRLRTESDPGAGFGYCTASNYVEIVGTCSNPHCPVVSITMRRFPATIEFLGGRCGDLLSEISVKVAKRSVGLELSASFREIELKEVVLYPNSKPPCGMTADKLCELWFPINIPWNPTASTLELVWKCDACGRSKYRVQGTSLPRREERIGGRWKWVPASPRKKGMGVILREEDLNGVDFFRFGGSLYMATEQGRRFIEKRQWANFAFQEYGEIV
jgi:hypothetical protein